MKTPTRMFCQICGHLHKIDFWVPDEIWDEAIHPRFKNTHICLNCFMERADEKLLHWDKDIKLMPCSMASQVKIQVASNCDHLFVEARDITLKDGFVCVHCQEYKPKK